MNPSRFCLSPRRRRMAGGALVKLAIGLVAIGALNLLIIAVMTILPLAGGGGGAGSGNGANPAAATVNGVSSTGLTAAGSSGSTNIGTPSVTGQGYTISGAAAIDYDGSPTAYAPPGSGLVGDDNLANAGHPGNWWGIQTDNGLPSGNPVIGPNGYYISTTSATMAAGANGALTETSTANGGTYLNAATTNYIALGTGQANGAQYGDYVQVTNNSTGQTTWAVYGDSRGSNNSGIEMSQSTASSIGVGYNSSGTTSNAGNISITVYPGSRNTGKPGGG